MAYLQSMPTFVVLLVLVISLFILSRAADFMVNKAVRLSKLWGLSQLVIGATIVSLGTTLPELSASVVSALQGHGSFALGNAVGSVIVNTSLVLGIGTLFGSIPVRKKESQKLTFLIVAVLMILLPSLITLVFAGEGRIPTLIGWLMLLMVPGYVLFIILQEKKDALAEEGEPAAPSQEKMAKLIVFIFISSLVIAGSATALVSSAEILAVRMGIPDVIIASTLVAFGTSVPELSTVIAAAKNNFGGLALGNILGADILNILFVVAVSVVMTPGGLTVAPEFFYIHFVALVLIIGIFSILAYNTKINQLKKREGILLIAIYGVYLLANLFFVR